MKKYIFIAVFFMSFQFVFSMDVETRFYNSGQTKAQVNQTLKSLIILYGEKKYYPTIIEKISDDDFTIKFTNTTMGGIANKLVKYQLFNDRITITIVNIEYINNDGSTFTATPDNNDQKIRTAYEAKKKIFTDVFFAEAKIGDNKRPLKEMK